MVLAKGSYIDLSNFNEATKLSEREPSISQQFIFNLVSQIFWLTCLSDE